MTAERPERPVRADRPQSAPGTAGASGADRPRVAGQRPRRPAAEPRRQTRGTQRRDAIVRAAAELILENGPTSVTHRTVAARADVPLAATTYYFSGLDELVEAAGRLLVSRWTAHTREVAERTDLPDTPEGRAERIVDALGPSGDDAAVRGFYEHLVVAGRSDVLGRTYAATRTQLDDTVRDLLDRLGLDLSPQLVIAVVDGAALTGLSEGRPVRPVALARMRELVRTVSGEDGA
ncbi:TetR/AcrR family transcriptional regulator [Luteimicrobium subarcticum]|uniref:TetR family transcriptional regulator n=1 Tax=Luteimicrobium subarcticum TaxID=620910 RepID=A0A2M8WVP9_9MICO|nr:TetR family transcriptional regulator [Luteimicrobium subarcticum]PJI94998.1 TetR family transcriptional regulator [Luteimicrobium subarcticum]